jgi:hypothetical protein
MSLTKYYPGIELFAGLKPSGDAKFPLMQACDILVDNDGKRLDTKLYELEGYPRPKVVETEAEMNKILANATEIDIGTIYKYTGNTTDTYEQGALYVITGEVLDGDEVSY